MKQNSKVTIDTVNFNVIVHRFCTCKVVKKKIPNEIRMIFLRIIVHL